MWSSTHIALLKREDVFGRLALNECEALVQCKNCARDSPHQFRRLESEEEPTSTFKHGSPSQEFLPCPKRTIDFILRLLSQETRYGLCLRLQLRQCGTTFPTKIKVGSDSTHSRIGDLAIQIRDKD